MEIGRQRERGEERSGKKHTRPEVSQQINIYMELFRDRKRDNVPCCCGRVGYVCVSLSSACWLGNQSLRAAPVRCGRVSPCCQALSLTPRGVTPSPLAPLVLSRVPPPQPISVLGGRDSLCTLGLPAIHATSAIHPVKKSTSIKQTQCRLEICFLAKKPSSFIFFKICIRGRTKPIERHSVEALTISREMNERNDFEGSLSRPKGGPELRKHAAIFSKGSAMFSSSKSASPRPASPSLAWPPTPWTERRADTGV